MTATSTLGNLQQASEAGLPASTQLANIQPRDTAVMPGFNSAGSWELAQRIGKAFASSDLVPQQYKGNLANCIVALEMANRMGASPLMVMQNLYIVHGTPGWSSKFLIATFNQSGKFSAMRYEFDRDKNGKATGCRAWAIEKSTGDKLIGSTVTTEMAQAEGWSTKSGSKWKTMPEQMLMYRAAAFLVRTYAPEISMGLRTADEITDGVIDAEPGTIRTVEQLRASSIDASTGEMAAAPTTPPANADAPTITREQVSAAISKAQNAEALDAALDLIRAVPDTWDQDDLRKLADKRAAEIQGSAA
jgi:hypothetical protein